MKIKSILFSVLLTGGYYFLCNYWEDIRFRYEANQGQWSENAMKAQEFLYDLNTPHYSCITGSSLGFNLAGNVLPNNYFNLCFRGQSVIDGLELLEYKERLPDTVFVEINYVSRGRSKDFKRKIASNRYEVNLKKHLIFLRDKYMPVGIVANYMEGKINFWRQRYKSLTIKPSANAPVKEIANGLPKIDKVREDIIRLSVKTMRIVPDTASINTTFSRTGSLLKALEAKGVTIVFFEMPIDCALVNSNLLNKNRKEMEQRFTKQHYFYIAHEGCGAYYTVDGLHLDHESAVRYTNYFVKQLQTGH